MGNTTLIACSVAMLVLVVAFCLIRWEQLDVVDVHVLAVGILFGGTALIAGLLKHLTLFDSFLISLVFFLVALTTGITWFSARLLPGRSKLAMRRLAGQWAGVNSTVIFVLLALVLAFHVYNYQQFGLLYRFSLLDPGTLGFSPPYWYTSVLSLIAPLTLCIALAITSKLLTSSALWSIPLAVVVPLSALGGRRDVFFVLAIVLLLWILMSSRFKIKYALMALLTIGFLFAMSNVYQSYRNAYETGPSFIEATQNSQATLENLTSRESLWEFNYWILRGQEQQPADPPGEILVQGLENSIPSIMWSDKSVYTTDQMIADRYHLLQKDYSTNDFASTQADFNYLSVFILPLLYFLVLGSMVLFLQVAGSRPTLILLLSGFFLYYLISIEKDYSAIFQLYRNISVIFAIYLVSNLTLTLIASSATPKRVALRR